MRETHDISTSRYHADRATRAGRFGHVHAIAATAVLAIVIAACSGGSDPVDTTPTDTEAIAEAPTTDAPVTTDPPATTTTTTVEVTISTDPPPSEDCPEFTPNEELPVVLCDSGALVLEVQQGLVDAGYDLVVDGFFGAQTQVGVVSFQSENDLEVDGVVGPLTFAALFPEDE